MTKKYRIQTIILIFLLILIFALQTLSPKIINHYQKIKAEKSRTETIKKVSTPPTSISNSTTLHPLPKRGYLEVQFICQAPLQTVKNWELHEESCEEAAILQVMNYEKRKTNTPEEANQIILDMIKWQKENFGEHKDLFAKKIKDFIIKYYGIEEKKVEIITNASIKDIKNAIRNGHPVIVPITGEILKNPYYKYPGYHMLVVTGFTEDKIITNDNGTRHGEDFSYDTNIFQKAFKDASGDIVIIKL